MQTLDLEHLSSCIIVIIAPHMDDEALACGGLIALLPNKERIHIIYATDGSRSPAPVFTWQGKVAPDLSKARMQELMEAMYLLGLPKQNLHFFCLPDGKLQKHIQMLRASIQEKISSIEPRYIFIPFRYDRHPDHLAVNHAIAAEVAQVARNTQVAEYFVYHRWRLLPKRDIRKYIKPQYLFQLDIEIVAAQKRQALDRFVSQVSNYYPWQTRPILTSALLDEECQNPEYFVIAPGSLSGTDVFSSAALWIRLSHRIEPVLLRCKAMLYSLAPRIFQIHVLS